MTDPRFAPIADELENAAVLMRAASGLSNRIKVTARQSQSDASALQENVQAAIAALGRAVQMLMRMP